MKENKIGRNDPCPCGSGKKYKHCHIGFGRPLPNPPTGEVYKMNSEGIKSFNKIMHLFAAIKLPLHEFCIEKNIYFFEGMSVEQYLNVINSYENNNLATDFLIEQWIIFNTQEYFERMLQNDKNRNGFLSKQEDTIKQIIMAHFAENYALSIPALFSIIEGLFREYGQVSFDINQKPVYQIKENKLDEKMLYAEIDAIRYFTKFLNKLMSGKSSVNQFHRNTVMHGVNREFATKENSLLLLMTIFEFSRLENLEKMWPPNFEFINGDAYCNGMKIEMRKNFDYLTIS